MSANPLAVQTPGNPPAMPTSPPLSAGLKSLLDAAAATTDGSPGRIAMFPALVDEARAALPALKAYAVEAAGEAGVKWVIGQRFAIYPPPQRSEAEWAAWWADYFRTLREMPLASLEAAMRAWVADPASEFMPKPGQLQALARRTPSRALTRYTRAAAAVQLADATFRPRERVPPDEVRRILEGYLKTSRSIGSRIAS